MAIAPVDVTLSQFSAANAAVSGALSPGSLTVVAGDTLILIGSIVGTGTPTLTTPGGWTLLRQVNVSTTRAFYMWALFNASGATNPSSTAAGTTVTGVTLMMFEFTATGANEGNMAVFGAAYAPAPLQLNNIFANAGQQMPHSLFVYALTRASITPVTSQNTILNWSASINPQTANGIQTDFYWASNLNLDNPAAYQYSGAGPAPVSNSSIINADTINSGLQGLPSCSGLLSASVQAAQIGAIFNSAAVPAQEGCNVGGAFGLYVPQFFQGMIGG